MKRSFVPAAPAPTCRARRATLITVLLAAATAATAAGRPTAAADAVRPLQSAAVAAATPPTILVLGDSISAGYGIALEQGWVALLQRRLADQGYGYRVVNASVSGETTTGGLNRLPRALALHRPAIVIVELGGNDGLRGLPLETTRDNLQRIVQLTRGARARVLLVGMKIPPNYGPRYASGFEQIFSELARRERLPLLPFFLDKVALTPGLMQADGIHPNAAGQPVLLANLWPVLLPLLRATTARSEVASRPAAGAK
ncbi:MAG: arylesterase [Steroidobacteraceae bacterium]